MNDDDPWEWMLPVIAMLLFTLAVASYTVTVERGNQLYNRRTASDESG